MKPSTKRKLVSKPKTVRKKTKKQHIGGKAGLQGYSFQDFVSALRLLHLANQISAHDVHDVLIRQEVPESNVDDLHITWGEYRRHIQIKSTKAPSWSSELVADFKAESTKHPAAQLELCVRSKVFQQLMTSTRHAHRLGFVEISSVDIHWMAEPYSQEEIQDLLDGVSLMPYHPTRYHGMWNDVIGSWIGPLKRHSTLAEAFHRISEASSWTIAALTPTTSDMDAKIYSLNQAYSGFSFASDGDTIVMSFPAGRGVSSVSQGWSNIPTAFWDNIPNDPWDLFQAFGGFKC